MRFVSLPANQACDPSPGAQQEEGDAIAGEPVDDDAGQEHLLLRALCISKRLGITDHKNDINRGNDIEDHQH